MTVSWIYMCMHWFFLGRPGGPIVGARPMEFACTDSITCKIVMYRSDWHEFWCMRELCNSIAFSGYIATVTDYMDCIHIWSWPFMQCLQSIHMYCWPTDIIRYICCNGRMIYALHFFAIYYSASIFWLIIYSGAMVLHARLAKLCQRTRRSRCPS
jgi:hypothetical protein